MTEHDETPSVPGVSAEALPNGRPADAPFQQRSDVEHRDIPDATVARLVVYLRALSLLADEGTHIVSSEELARAAGVGSAKLRKDLSFLGSNGVRGVGYDVARLRARIEGALGVDQGHRVVLVGVGNLGRALAGYPGFGRRGFAMVALFDDDPALVGTTVAGLDVHDIVDLKAVCDEVEPTIGIIAVPDAAAQRVCDELVSAGVRRVLSFAQVASQASEQVDIRRVDLAVELQMLSFVSARNAAHAEGDANDEQPIGRGGPQSRAAGAGRPAATAPQRAVMAPPTGATPDSKGAVVTP